MKKILIVDDDISIGNLLETALVKENYTVTRAYSGSEAVLFLEKNKVDLILLDLMLPGLSGEEVLQHISDTPVIVMSAKSEIGGKVDLLMNGAADYVTKPFNLQELLARIAVQLRGREKTANELYFNDIALNLEKHAVKVRDQFVKLTRTEFALLKILMQNPTNVVSRYKIMSILEEETPDCEESSLKTHIANLRAKLKRVSGKDYIEAIWGIGYKLISLQKS